MKLDGITKAIVHVQEHDSDQTSMVAISFMGEVDLRRIRRTVRKFIKDKYGLSCPPAFLKQGLIIKNASDAALREFADTWDTSDNRKHFEEWLQELEREADETTDEDTSEGPTCTSAETTDRAG